MQPRQQPFFTEAEYLAHERIAKTKSEYVNGSIYAMAGATIEHNGISSKFLVALSNRLRGRCYVFPSDQRIYCPATRLYTYPDLSVVCGPIERHPEDDMTITNPVLLVEVVSPSSEEWDRGGKFGHYKELRSLKDYLIVAQDEKRVDHYHRVEANQWMLTGYTGDSAVLALQSLGIEIPLAEIYEDLDALRKTVSATI